MAAEDELQIRIGLTVDGVGQSRRSSDQAEAKSRRTQVVVADTDRHLGRVENRARALQKQVLKQFGRFVIAGALTEGLDELVPNSDDNAISAVRSLGTNVAMSSIFLQSLRGGVYIGGLVTAIGLVQKGVEVLDRSVGGSKKKL